jgi:hypothetical protein
LSGLAGLELRLTRAGTAHFLAKKRILRLVWATTPGVLAHEVVHVLGRNHGDELDVMDAASAARVRRGVCTSSSGVFRAPEDGPPLMVRSFLAWSLYPTIRTGWETFPGGSALHLPVISRAPEDGPPLMVRSILARSLD